MTQPYIGQVQMFAFNFAPRNWAMCNGQIMGIQQNTALFSLLGTTYGGNGTSTFGLPNLQSRVTVGFGTAPYGEAFSLGEMAGTETVLLNITQTPVHTHNFLGANVNATTTTAVDGQALANVAIPSGTANSFYGAVANVQALNPATVSTYGGNLPHDNIEPYLTVNWCICQYGIYPSRN